MLRRQDKLMSDSDARQFLAEAGIVHLAGTGDGGQPILRTFNVVPLALPDGDGFAFHAAPAGEKLEAMGRPVVLQADEVLTTIPSYWLHPDKACPATTLYRSVQAAGVLEEVTDLDAKTAVLAALMTRYQPEGGYAPLDPTTRRYRGPISGLLVARVVPTAVTGKLAVGQHRPPDERAAILAGLWQRGRGGDLRAFDLLLAADPDVALPPCFAPFAARGLRPRLAWDPALADDLAALTGRPPRPDPAQARAAWLGLTAPDGHLVASIHGLSDGDAHQWTAPPTLAPACADLAPDLMAAFAAHPRMRPAPEA